MTTLIQTAVETTANSEGAAARIVLRTEAPTDLAKLDKVQPGDQDGYYRGHYEGACLILEKIDNPAIPPEQQPTADRKAAIARIAALPREQVRTMAAELGLAYDAKASRETLAEMIVDATPSP